MRVVKGITEDFLITQLLTDVARRQLESANPFNGETDIIFDASEAVVNKALREAHVQVLFVVTFGLHNTLAGETCLNVQGLQVNCWGCRGLNVAW